MFDLEAQREKSRAQVLGGQFLRFLPRVGLAMLFGLIGFSKFDNDPNGEWVRVFQQIGLGDWFRYFTGAVQIAGGILMLFSRTLTIGAAVLGATMLGAALVDVVILRSPLLIVPLLLFIIVATVWVTAD